MSLERPALARLQAPIRLPAEGTGVSKSVRVEELLRRGVGLNRGRFWKLAGSGVSQRRGLIQVQGAAVLEVVCAIKYSILSLLDVPF